MIDCKMFHVWYFTFFSASGIITCLGLDPIEHTVYTELPTGLDYKISEEISTQDGRRYRLVSATDEKTQVNENEDDKDDNLKVKIMTLVEQTIYDTEQKINGLKPLKDQYREQAPYKAGFILSLIKKSKDILNELFNVAIRHKNDWKALEQLKVFELIVHTNVDTTNLVRQLVEIHIQHMNATNTGEHRKRVVLLK